MGKNISARFNALIEKKVGLPISSIKRMESEDIIQHIEKKNHITMRLGEPDQMMSYRGNILLSMGHVVNNIEKEFEKTFN